MLPSKWWQWLVYGLLFGIGMGLCDLTLRLWAYLSKHY